MPKRPVRKVGRYTLLPIYPESDPRAKLLGLSGDRLHEAIIARRAKKQAYTGRIEFNLTHKGTKFHIEQHRAGSKVLYCKEVV